METIEGAGDALVRELQEELRTLRAELETLRRGLVGQALPLRVASDEPWLLLPPWHATAA